MIHRISWLLSFALCAFLPATRAESALLAKAFEQWATGREDFAFTQQSRALLDDGKVKEERLERYDPSLPDNARWRLLEVDGQPATREQREKWESKKNSRPRKKALKPPGDYLDLEHATLVEETPKIARFAIGLRPETARLLAVEKIAVVITVDKESASITGIGATLRQPIRVLLGLARITDLDVDVRIEPADDDSRGRSGAVHTGSTARATMSKLGNSIEYSWSDFKRVTPFGSVSKTD